MNLKQAKERADVHNGANVKSAIPCPCNATHNPTRECWEAIGFTQGYAQGREDQRKVDSDIVKSHMKFSDSLSQDAILYSELKSIKEEILSEGKLP